MANVVEQPPLPEHFMSGLQISIAKSCSASFILVVARWWIHRAGL